MKLEAKTTRIEIKNAELEKKELIDQIRILK